MDRHRDIDHASLLLLFLLLLLGGHAQAQEPFGRRLDATVREVSIDAVLTARHLEEEAVAGRMPTDAQSVGAYLREGRWSPYVVGIGLGILSWLTFLFCNQPLTASSAFAKSSGMLEKLVVGSRVENKAYYRKHPLGIDWKWMLVIGAIFGAFLSAWLSGGLTFAWTPALWRAGFGDTPVLRVGVAIFGGIAVGFGSRWAGGCTSGHGLSGTMQLVLSSWIAAICFFVGGIITAMLIYHVPA